MATKLAYADKVDAVTSTDVPANQKISAGDMNAIKTTVNKIIDEQVAIVENSDGTITLTYDDGK